MNKQRVGPPDQLELREPPPSPPPGRGPIVLVLGPRNWGVATWMRDERDVPVYRITQLDIRAASTAATMARQGVPDQGQQAMNRRAFLGTFVALSESRPATA